MLFFAYSDNFGYLISSNNCEDQGFEGKSLNMANHTHFFCKTRIGVRRFLLTDPHTWLLHIPIAKIQPKMGILTWHSSHLATKMD